MTATRVESGAEELTSSGAHPVARAPAKRSFALLAAVAATAALLDQGTKYLAVAGLTGAFERRGFQGVPELVDPR